jgi:hypothetical protein
VPRGSRSTARLDLLRVAADAVGLDMDRDRRFPRLRGERLGQSLVRQQRRVAAAREVAEVLERVGGLGLQTREHRAERLVVLVDERGGEPLLHREGDELLLRPVVDVALEFSAESGSWTIESQAGVDESGV